MGQCIQSNRRPIWCSAIDLPCPAALAASPERKKDTHTRTHAHMHRESEKESKESVEREKERARERAESSIRCLCFSYRPLSPSRPVLTCRRVLVSCQSDELNCLSASLPVCRLSVCLSVCLSACRLCCPTAQPRALPHRTAPHRTSPRRALHASTHLTLPTFTDAALLCLSARLLAFLLLLASGPSSRRSAPPPFLSTSLSPTSTPLTPSPPLTSASPFRRHFMNG